MKIIATGDWHIGNLFHGNDRLSEHKHFFNWLLSRLEELKPDALLVAGDVFDNANPSAAAQAIYYDFITEATKKCPEMKIVISAGNHDSAFRLEAPRSLLTERNVEVRGKVKKNWVSDENGGSWNIDFDDLIIPLNNTAGEKFLVLVVPFLRSDVMEGDSYSEGVNRIIRDLTQYARDKYPGLPLVMMAHMYAKGSEIAEKDASEKIIIGGQEEVNMDGWEDHPDYFTSGHIHKRQHIWNTNWARYTGSILPMSFAEIDYHHGVDLVTISPDKKLKVEFLEYVPQHKLRIFPDEGIELPPKKLLKLIKEELPDRGDGGQLDDKFEYLLLKVKQDKVNNDEIKELESLISRKNVVLCKIHKILPAMELHSGVLEKQLESVEDILNRDPLETLKDTFKIEHKREMSEIQENMLKSILQSISEEE